MKLKNIFTKTFIGSIVFHLLCFSDAFLTENYLAMIGVFIPIILGVLMMICIFYLLKYTKYKNSIMQIYISWGGYIIFYIIGFFIFICMILYLE